MTPQQLEKLADIIVDNTKKAMEPLRSRIADLERSNAELKQRVAELSAYAAVSIER